VAEVIAVTTAHCTVGGWICSLIPDPGIWRGPSSLESSGLSEEMGYHGDWKENRKARAYMG
jgi:hypothetical protein